MEYLNEFIKSLIPIKFEIEVGALTAFLGTVSSFLFGQYDALMQAILVVMLMDYITGVLAATIMSNVKLDSHKGWVGLKKKVAILFIIALAHLFDYAAGQGDMVRNVVIWFYLGNEGLSILENAANCGVPVPNKIKDKLAQFANDKANR